MYAFLKTSRIYGYFIKFIHIETCIYCASLKDLILILELMFSMFRFIIFDIDPDRTGWSDRLNRELARYPVRLYLKNRFI